MDACISSNVRPLVSGTSFATNRIVNPHTLENIKNVPEKTKKNFLSGALIIYIIQVHQECVCERKSYLVTISFSVSSTPLSRLMYLIICTFKIKCKGKIE